MSRSLKVTSSVSLFLFGAALFVCTDGAVEGTSEAQAGNLSTVASVTKKRPVEKPGFIYVSSNNYLQVVSHDGAFSDYVGCFNCAFNSPESIFNPNGFFYSRLIPINSEYGGTFSDKSMCNFAAQNPPHLEMWGLAYSLGDLRASVNQFHANSICNQFSSSFWDTGCRNLKQLCGI